MQASLRALLTGLIDYAGLFPPAGLPLDQAIRNYARYQQEPESWMLTRFVCPAKQLGELVPFVEELFDSRRQFHYCGLANPAEIAEALDAVRRFQEKLGARALIDGLECKVPPVDALVSILETRRTTRLTFFFEPVLGNDWRDDVSKATSLPTAVALGYMRAPVFGVKLRCGGLEPSAFPAPEQVAFTIAACRDAKIPLKFTAGLHHPIRHFNAGVQTHMHGFINVFTAGVLAHARSLSAEQLRPIIEDEDAGDFHFDEEGLSWKDYRASTEEIIQARRSAVTSFGSCSFDEPRDDLRNLGWM
jgi:hypothetical protein